MKELITDACLPQPNLDGDSWRHYLLRNRSKANFICGTGENFGFRNSFILVGWQSVSLWYMGDVQLTIVPPRYTFDLEKNQKRCTRKMIAQTFTLMIFFLKEL